MVESRGAHIDLCCKVIDTKGLCEVILQPISRPRYLLALTSHRRHLAESCTLIAHQQTVENFLLDDRSKDRDVLRLVKQIDQPLNGGEDRPHDLAGRHSTARLLRSGRGDAVNHQLRYLALIEPQYEPQVAFLPARTDDLHHRGQIHRCKQEMVCIIYLRVVSKLHAFGPLSDHANARFIQDTHRFTRLVPPSKYQSRDRGLDPVAYVGPSSNTISQGFECTFQLGIPNYLLMSSLSHACLLFIYYQTQLRCQSNYGRFRTIRQEMNRIGLQTFALSGVGYDHKKGRT